MNVLDSFKKLLFLFVFLFFICLWRNAEAEPMYSKSSGVNVMSEKKGDSDVLETLGAGDQVEKLEDDARWAKVKTQAGNTGYVFKFKLSPEKPASAEGEGLLGGLLGSSGDEIASRESSTSASIRGIKPISEENAKNSKIEPKYIEDFKKMQKYEVSRQELNAFLRDGKLGEYGE